MFSFVTDRVNPLGGRCPYQCSYCWARDYQERFGYLQKRYTGPPRLFRELLKRYEEGDFVWAVTMRDPLSPDVTDDMINELFTWMRMSPRATFLLLTKNPARYVELFNLLPENLVCGATVESNRDYPELSKAPSQWHRLFAMWELRQLARNQRFLCVEPVLDFKTRDFYRKIVDVAPWAVAIGYDNYNNRLPEPGLRRVYNLLERIAPITTVYVKTLREKWDS